MTENWQALCERIDGQADTLVSALRMIRGARDELRRLITHEHPVPHVRAVVLERISRDALPGDEELAAWIATVPNAQARAHAVRDLFGAPFVTGMTPEQLAERLLETGDPVAVSVEAAEAQRKITDQLKAADAEETARYHRVLAARRWKEDQELRRQNEGHMAALDAAGRNSAAKAVSDQAELRRQEDQVLAEHEAFEREQREAMVRRMGSVQP